MVRETRFGYLRIINQTPYILEFNKNYLKVVDRFNSEDRDKFIQVNINGKYFIRVGDLYHRRILKETLNEFGLKFDTKLNKHGFEMPAGNGENYKLIGAGKIKLSYPSHGESSFSESLDFYDASSDYFDCVRGTNKDNLEKIFGKERVTEYLGIMRLPSFLVRI
jgi:hypothetical protein